MAPYRIGELSLLKDLSATSEIITSDDDSEKSSQKKQYSSESSSTVLSQTKPDGSVSSTTESGAVPLSPEELKKKKKKFTREQREELMRLDRERRERKQIRVLELSDTLIKRISEWTESDKSKEAKERFEAKLYKEAEELKMESFGIELLHTIGKVYVTKASNFLKAQKTFGISKLYTSTKEKGSVAKNAWNILSSSIDAQMAMEDMTKAQQSEDWDEAKAAEFERFMTGKFINTAWVSSKFEIQDVLRAVCEHVLNDKSISSSKRVERAKCLLNIGTIFKKSERSGKEAEEARVFEELMEEATQKKKNKKRHGHGAQLTSPKP